MQIPPLLHFLQLISIFLHVNSQLKCATVAAASILAKVTRDRLMVEYDDQYPGYGFAVHKGYGTKAHYAAIDKLGLCPIHRRTFLKSYGNR
ncbi:MAG: hypothetical protein II769_03150 [Oscillospiraceae bacterium]|nr:hypothetical protein [Oscillospiraceae bacterium]